MGDNLTLSLPEGIPAAVVQKLEITATDRNAEKAFLFYNFIIQIEKVFLGVYAPCIYSPARVGVTVGD